VKAWASTFHGCNHSGQQCKCSSYVQDGRGRRSSWADLPPEPPEMLQKRWKIGLTYLVVMGVVGIAVVATGATIS
jgi:hypothetical protein